MMYLNSVDNPLDCIFEHGFCAWKQPKRNYKMDWLWTNSNAGKGKVKIIEMVI